MNDFLYHRELLRLAKNRRDDSPLSGDDVFCVRRDNPLCGDSISLQCRKESPRIFCLSQQTRGCVLCEAAAAQMMQLAAADSSPVFYRALCRLAAQMFSDDAAAKSESERGIIKDETAGGMIKGENANGIEGENANAISSALLLFSPVVAHPARRECVLLPFRALSDILAAADNAN